MPADQPDLDAAIAICKTKIETSLRVQDKINRGEWPTCDLMNEARVKETVALARVLDALDRLRQPAPADDALDAAARELIAAKELCDQTHDVYSYRLKCANHAAAIAQLALDRGAALRAERERNAALEAALKPFADVWNGNQDGTSRLPWEACKTADNLLKESRP